MLNSGLLFASLLSFVVAAIYGYVGRRLYQRSLADTEIKLAWQLFTLWWFGLAATTFIQGLLNLLGALNFTNLTLFIIFTHINLFSTCVALCGLLYYLLYLFTGQRRLLAAIVLFYLVYYATLVYYITAARPVGVILEKWRVGLDYEAPLSNSPYFILILIFLVFPQIIGSLAYFSLYFRVQDVSQKYRVALVSWSIIIWFSAAFLAVVAGLAEQDWWQITSRLIGLAAAATILAAYLPPTWIKQRYKIVGISDL